METGNDLGRVGCGASEDASAPVHPPSGHSGRVSRLGFGGVETISEALAASAKGASEFTRSLFSEDLWTGEQVVAFINQQRNATIASTNTNAQPHAAVVIAASVHEAMYFTVAPSSVLARNLAVNARIGFSVCDSRHAVMGQGFGVRVGQAGSVARLIGELAQASPSGRFTPEGWEGDIYRVDFRRIFAN